MTYHSWGTTLMVRLYRAAMYTTVLVCVTSTAHAQARAGAATTRAEIQLAVRAYVKSINEMDLSTYAETYSRQPGVTSVGDGTITRGWDQIREAADRHLNLAGKFSFTTGSIDVILLGPGYAMAVMKTIVKAGDPSGPQIQREGAMTLLFQKTEGEWKIIHDHTSFVEDTTNSAALTAPASTTKRAPRAEVPPPTAFHIADGSAVEIQAAGYYHYDFQLPAASCAFSGRIVGISGGKKDFEALIMSDDNYENWKAHQQAMAIWQSGRVVVTSMDNAAVSGPGMFHLVLSNIWSGVTAKTVQPQVLVSCS
jgi:uncharacterized protein (TIGR02246 family)